MSVLKIIMAWAGNICLLIANLLVVYAIVEAKLEAGEYSDFVLVLGNLLTVPLGLAGLGALLIAGWLPVYWCWFLLPFILLVLGLWFLTG